MASGSLRQPPRVCGERHPAVTVMAEKLLATFEVDGLAHRLRDLDEVALGKTKTVSRYQEHQTISLPGQFLDVRVRIPDGRLPRGAFIAAPNVDGGLSVDANSPGGR